VRQLHRVSIRHVLQVVGKLIRAGHSRTPHEHWHDRNIPAQSRRQLNTHKIGRIIQAPRSRLISRIEPVLTDYSQQDGARRHPLVDRLPEVLARFDPGNVHEDGALAEVLL
jgi:hypothetical protein